MVVEAWDVAADIIQGLARWRQDWIRRLHTHPGWQRPVCSGGLPTAGRCSGRVPPARSRISCRESRHGLSPRPRRRAHLRGWHAAGPHPPRGPVRSVVRLRERRCQDAVACWSPTEWTGTPPTSSAWLGHGGHRTRVLRTARGRWAATEPAGGVPKPWGNTGVWSSSPFAAARDVSACGTGSHAGSPPHPWGRLAATGACGAAGPVGLARTRGPTAPRLTSSVGRYSPHSGVWSSDDPLGLRHITTVE